MNELHISPERHNRNLVTGRFLKGCIPHNKGKSMGYHSKLSQKRSLAGLAKEGNKYRRFFFQKQLRQEAMAYMKENGKTGLLAVGKFGALTQRGFSQHLKAWGKHCGIDSRKMHAHAFRHFFAKMYLKKSKNKDVVQLADLLGHGSVDTTRIYLQKSYDEQKRDFNQSVTW